MKPKLAVFAKSKISKSSLSSVSSFTPAWSTINGRLRIFVLGVILGAFVLRPLAIHNYYLLFASSSMMAATIPGRTEQNEENHHYPSDAQSSSSSSSLSSSTAAANDNQDNSSVAGLSKSKSNFLQASHTATNQRRFKRRRVGDQSSHQSTNHEPPVNEQEPQLQSETTILQEQRQQVLGSSLLPQELIIDFERQPRVVIATKIHGPAHMPQLIQSMCLLKAAYNNRPKYDVVVFLTLPISTMEEETLRQVVHPAHLKMVLDDLTLADHIQAMSLDQSKHLLQRCQVNSTQDLFWWTRCCEEWTSGACMPLSYSWQSEFRSLHIWSSPALKPYKYMMWFDSDAMPTKVWEQDPIAFMIRNELKMLYNNFPQGRSAGEDVQDKIRQAYNDTLCKVKLIDGHLAPIRGEDCPKAVVANIHGFFHISDLDFYRNDENLQWSRIMIGNKKFSRRWDDQLAVTVPAAMRAPELSWDMNYHNITLDVYHNGLFDGKRRWELKNGKVARGYQKWWNEYRNERFPEAVPLCQEWVRNAG